MDLKRTHCPLGIWHWLLPSCPAPWVIQAKTAEPEKGNGPPTSALRKSKVGIFTPEGKPFFAHGITHARNLANLDFKKFSEACKDIGFNAYGYGCPQQLREDMPYLASWNHLVPISYYRGKNGVQFLDVFDPKVESRLEAGVKAYCGLTRRHRATSSAIAGRIWLLALGKSGGQKLGRFHTQSAP